MSVARIAAVTAALLGALSLDAGLKWYAVDPMGETP